MELKKVIISGGGTGGHIYPAIAIADEIKPRYPNADILFVGAKGRMEMERVPKSGYPIKGLWISGIQRKLTLDNLSFPIKVLSSMYKARKIIKAFHPDIVVGTGGFASGPLLKVAEMNGIPCVIQEQNSYAGITNKWLSKGASKICVAYDNMQRFFPIEKIVKTGNPVRKDLLGVEEYKSEAVDFYKFNGKSKKLLVLGGSLGALAINQLVEKQLSLFQSLGIEVLWQCGKLYYDRYKKYDNGTNVKVVPFIEKMNYAYALADIIISRAGASSVSELCVVGKPVIFVPSPNVAEDHQTKNAQAVTNKNAAILIKESDLAENFKNIFTNLVKNEDKQQTLSENIKTMALPNATKDIVNEIEKLVKTL